MPSTQQFRRRIKSVRSTAQITKAMEMVATSKMRKATEATVASRPYTGRLSEILHNFMNNPEHPLTHPLLEQRPEEKILAIVIASDRGMAGAYNTNIIRQVIDQHKVWESEGKKVDYITMGTKVESVISRLGHNLIQSYPHTSSHPTSKDIVPLNTFAIKEFRNGTYDRVYVFYTFFKSMLQQESRITQLLPFIPEPVDPHPADVSLHEPSGQEIVDLLVPRLVEVHLYQAVQEALASEHSARRMAMKNATDNANSMIDDLVLTYNSIRQSAITQEIAEITGGAAALTA